MWNLKYDTNELIYGTERQTHSKLLAQRQKNTSFSLQNEGVGMISKYTHG